MGLQTNMMGTGMPPATASAVAGAVQLAQTATGSDQAGAFAITQPVTEFTTTASSTGARLPATTAGIIGADSGLVMNNGANTLTLYPPTGGKINGGSANAGVSVATLKAASWTARGNGDYFVIVGA